MHFVKSKAGIGRFHLSEAIEIASTLQELYLAVCLHNASDGNS